MWVPFSKKFKNSNLRKHHVVGGSWIFTLWHKKKDIVVCIYPKGEWIANNLHPNDNVVIPTTTDEPFWLMLMEKGIHVVDNSFTNFDGNEWTQGDMVVRGYCYEWLQVESHSYILQNDQPLAFVFSHLIFASKFSLPPTSHMVKGSYITYELKDDVIEFILEGWKHS
jgi:hypothetical protein